MRIRIWTTLCLLPLLTASCSRQEEPGIKRGPLTVTIGTMPGIAIDSRTALDDDGFSVRWVKGDRIALWARNSAGEVLLSAVPFALYSFDETYRSAKFTGTVDPMPEDSYTYYALSPIPASTEGTLGVYSIPAVQDGAFHSDYDIMAAEPVTGRGLVAGDNSDAVSLAFSHKVHLLKIRIPENRLGEPVTGLRITFPEPVAGTLRVDAADPDAAPLLTDGSNTLTLEFPIPVDAGAIVYATIAPVMLDATVPVTLTGICQTGESKSIKIPGKDFAAGHTTPISFTIPEIASIYTKIIFSIDGTGEETLGEKIERFTVTGPEGSDLGDGTNSRSFEVETGGTYVIRFRDGVPAEIPGATFTVTYESESAVVSDTFIMPELTAETTNSIPALTVPYLMYEDFSSIPDFDYGTKSLNSGNGDAIPGLNGWSTFRGKGTAGNSIAIQLYSFFSSAYPSRLDSAPLSGLKPEANVSVKVRFRGGVNNDNNKRDINLIIGNETREGNPNVNESIDNSMTNVTLVYDTAVSWTNIPEEHETTVANCGPASRIVWKTNTGGKGTGKYEQCYIDEIKVSIVK